MPQGETTPRLSVFSRPPLGHRWARWLAPGWSAPWPWCSSSASFCVRCVPHTSQPPLLRSRPALFALLKQPIHTPLLPPTQRASRGHKSLAAAVSASVKERAVLFAASPHEWYAARAWGFSSQSRVRQRPHRLAPRLPSQQGGTQRVAAPDADVLRVPRGAGGHGSACAGVLLFVCAPTTRPLPCVVLTPQPTPLGVRGLRRGCPPGMPPQAQHRGGRGLQAHRPAPRVGATAGWPLRLDGQLVMGPPGGCSRSGGSTHAAISGWGRPSSSPHRAPPAPAPPRHRPRARPQRGQPDAEQSAARAQRAE